MRRWILCVALLVGCRSAEDVATTPGPVEGGCVGSQPCHSYTCRCGTKFTVCASCRGGTWEWPIDDNCYFSCPRTPPGPEAGVCVHETAFDGTCTAPAKKAATTACTDAALDEILAACSGTATDPARCASAKAAAPACAACVSTWSATGLDEAACLALSDPDCAQSTQCAADCRKAVCPPDDCDPTPGSGKSSTRSQWQDCVEAAEAVGPCAAKAAAREACAIKAPACFARADGDLHRALRTLCHLGGAAPAGDAGATDAGTDAGAGDAGTDG